MDSISLCTRARFGREHEHGAIVALVAVLFGVIAAVGVLAYGSSMAGLVDRQLQVAADSAAHAGASVLCSTQQCFQNSLTAAKSVLRQTPIRGATNAGSTLNVGFGPETSWSGNGYLVTVERGRITRTDSGFSGFESLEGSWQTLHPGVPVFLIANAVRVVVQRPSTHFISSIIGRNDYSLLAEAVALKGDPQSQCVAPFAVPVCNLLTSQGQYDASELCVGDRIFGPAGRYCSPGNTNCRAVPTAHMIDAMGNRTVDSFLFWRNPRFPDPADHFGVVGLPDDGTDLTETKIREIIDPNGPGCVTAPIGSRYQVLSSGLQEPATDAALYERMLLETNPTFREAGLGTLEQNMLTLCTSTSIVQLLICQALAQQVARNPPPGACNSKWVTLSLVAETCPVLERSRLPNGEVMTTDNTHVWDTTVPVIANWAENAQACSGVAGETRPDPVIDIEQDWRVVGYTKITLYDSDIGKPPPFVEEGITPTFCTVSPIMGGRGGTITIPIAQIPYFSFSGGNCNQAIGRLQCTPHFLPVGANPSIHTALIRSG